MHTEALVILGLLSVYAVIYVGALTALGIAFLVDKGE